MTDTIKSKSDIRKGLIGVIEYHEGLVPVSLHFSEWWNGEGLDFNFLNESNKTISLHDDEITALIIAAKIGLGINLKDIEKQAKEIRQSYKNSRKELKRLRGSIKNDF